MAIVEKVQHSKYSIITTDASTGVWQYSMWIKSENKHFRQSLRTKNRDLAEDKAEELFYEIKHKLRNNRKVFSPSIKNACDMYIKIRENDLKLKTITAGHEQLQFVEHCSYQHHSDGLSLIQKRL